MLIFVKWIGYVDPLLIVRDLSGPNVFYRGCKSFYKSLLELSIWFQGRRKRRVRGNGEGGTLESCTETWDLKFDRFEVGHPSPYILYMHISFEWNSVLLPYDPSCPRTLRVYDLGKIRNSNLHSGPFTRFTFLCNLRRLIVGRISLWKEDNRIKEVLKGVCRQKRTQTSYTKSFTFHRMKRLITWLKDTQNGL